MQYITIEQQETISFPIVQPLSSYVFLDGHIEQYNMEAYNVIAMSTDTEGHVIVPMTESLLHSVEMQVFIDSFLAETGYIPEQLITLIAVTNVTSF